MLREGLWCHVTLETPAQRALIAAWESGGLGHPWRRLVRAGWTDAYKHDLVGSLSCNNVLRWHQDLQDVLAAVALGEQLLDELEQTPQRVTSYRTNLLSDGNGSLCEREPFRFRP